MKSFRALDLFCGAGGATKGLQRAGFHVTGVDIIGRGRMMNDRRKGTLNAGSSKGAWGRGGIITVAGGQFAKKDGEIALGIDWMTKEELAQSIPPAYSEFIGRAALNHLTRAAA